jgi:hypothetical protein
MPFDLTEGRDDEPIRLMLVTPRQRFASIHTDSRGGARFEMTLLQ